MKWVKCPACQGFGGYPMCGHCRNKKMVENTHVAGKGKRGPIEEHVGTIRVVVNLQQEVDDMWVGRVVGNHVLAYGATREEAIERACEVASCAEQQDDIT